MHTLFFLSLINCDKELRMIENETEIIVRVKKSDESAFRILYEEYAPRIFAFLCRKLNEPVLAEDMVQEVFVKVWKNRESLNEFKSTKAYLFTAANNIAIDYFRKKKMDSVDIDDYENAAFYRFEQDFDIPEHIKKAIDKLTPMQRNVFYLSRFEGMKHAEISEILNISKRTVENHISRALLTLRKNLEYLLLFFISFLMSVFK